MATQGERRRQAIAAMRAITRDIRRVDSSIELAYRTARRLVTRKTLIGPDQIVHLGDQIKQFVMMCEAVQKAYVILASIINSLPR